jgi:peptidoglycan hydrolase FlgJ
MDITPIQRRLEASDVPTEQLAGNAQLTEAQKIGEATRQFEAMLLRQILAESQKSAITSSFTDNSTAAGIYRDLATNQLAESISKSGTVGLAKTLEREFTRQLQAAAVAGPDSEPAALPTGLAAARPHPLSANLDQLALKTEPSLRRAAAAFAHHE